MARPEPAAFAFEQIADRRVDHRHDVARDGERADRARRTGAISRIGFLMPCSRRSRASWSFTTAKPWIDACGSSTFAELHHPKAIAVVLDHGQHGPLGEPAPRRRRCDEGWRRESRSTDRMSTAPWGWAPARMASRGSSGMSGAARKVRRFTREVYSRRCAHSSIVGSPRPHLASRLPAHAARLNLRRLRLALTSISYR